MRLISIKESNRGTKKYMATFNDDGTIYITHFGARGYEDYTIHKDDVRKGLYLLRHSRENWNNPLTAGALSRWILWNKPTLKASITDFKNKFNL